MRVTVGRKSLADGKVELKMRAGGDVEKISPDAIVEEVVRCVRAAKAS